MPTTTSSERVLPAGDMDVLCWRYEQLVAAGFPAEWAVRLAEAADVDLHTACGLLERGASIEQALRILV